ncbi:MAG TPA: GNAT family N-acetyltransferase [Flavobacterium lutivivi]|nr:GNAT family N-acetyltransferase [Flavobacterium lutivivi]
MRIIETSPNDFEVHPLIEALSNNLESRFGSSGKNSFQNWEFDNSQYVFVKCIIENEVVGCGALRPLSNEIAEIKRMYSKYSRKGIGNQILLYLENKAMNLGFSKIYLETRKLNAEACSFYLKNNYVVIPNYGKYVNNNLAICFGKNLIN